MREESGAKKCLETALSLTWRMTCFGITGGMRSTPTSSLEAMLMLSPIHLFIRQAANRLTRNGYSYVQNFGHSEVLIRMTDETRASTVGSKGQIWDP
jgi:hypothetical protein